jgi:hypothetical protein
MRDEIRLYFERAHKEHVMSSATPKIVCFLWMLRQRHTAAAAVYVVVATLLAAPAWAQYNGSHAPGDFGAQAGTQPASGFYVAPLYFHYNADTLKGPDGNDLSPAGLAGTAKGQITLAGAGVFVWYVSKAKVLGAHYGAMATLVFTNNALDAPVFGLNTTTSAAIGDTFISPINLGWHTKHADVMAGFGFYAPTGNYTAGGSANTGLGMWTYEPMVGTTVYFDDKKTVSVATNAYWDIAGTKSGTSTKVGQILLLEGGAGKSFLGGGLLVGAAYYGIWKVTADNIGSTIALPVLGRVVGPTLDNIKSNVFALGPEITLPIASQSKLFALVTVRYEWEVAAHTHTQGRTLMVFSTFPIPSVKLH